MLTSLHLAKKSFEDHLIHGNIFTLCEELGTCAGSLIGKAMDKLGMQMLRHTTL